MDGLLATARFGTAIDPAPTVVTYTDGTESGGRPSRACSTTAHSNWSKASRIRGNVVVGLPGFDGLPWRRDSVVRSGVGIGEDRVCLRVRIVAPGLQFIGGEGIRAALDAATIALVIALRRHRTHRTDR